jgi:hypothetical protein
MSSFEFFNELLTESDNILGELPQLSNNNYQIKIKDRYLTIYYKFGDFSFLPEFISKKLKQVFLIIGAYEFGPNALNNPNLHLIIYEYYKPFIKTRPEFLNTLCKTLHYIRVLGWINWCDTMKQLLNIPF